MRLDPLTLEMLGDVEDAEFIDEINDIEIDVEDAITPLGDAEYDSMIEMGGPSKKRPIRAVAKTKRPTISKKAATAGRNMAAMTGQIVNSIPYLANSVKRLPFYGPKNGLVLNAPFDHSSYMANAQTLSEIVNRTAQYCEAAYQKSGVSSGSALTITIASADLTAAGLGDHHDFMVGVNFGASAFSAVPGAPVKITITGSNSGGQSLSFGTWTIERREANKPVSIFILPFRLVAGRPFLSDVVVNSSYSLSVTVDSVPSGEMVTVTLPGQLHSFATEVRKSLGLKAF